MHFSMTSLLFCIVDDFSICHNPPISLKLHGWKQCLSSFCVFSGSVFVFRNRSGKAVKLLVFDGQGFWLCQKRLSTGRFRWWPRSATESGKTLEAYQLGVLLSGGDPSAAAGAPPWRRVNANV
jgi:hypothetical protein